jgi:hypothetical protein
VKNQRFQFEYKSSASKLHKKIGETLRTSSSFKNYRIYQEYPVSKINPNCLNNRLHFDWVVLDLKLIIEGMGKQHFEIVDFSGKEEDKGYSKFQDLIYRDKLKRKFAEEAGWNYITISHEEEKTLTDDLITAKYMKCNYGNSIRFIIEDPPILKEIRENIKEKRREYLKSDKHKQELKDASAKRREIYRRSKQSNLAHGK